MATDYPEFGTPVPTEQLQEFGTPVNEPSQSLEFGTPVLEEPSLGQIGSGLGVEIGSGIIGQAGGTALGAAIGSAVPIVGTAIGAGIGYTVGSIGSGIAGSIAAQKIEGHDDIQWGRAIASGLLNLIPGGSSKIVKGGVQIGTRTLGQVAAREAAKGAAGAAGEVIVRDVIDEGRLPSAKELAESTAIGTIGGGLLGAAGQKFAKKFAGKTIGQLDDDVATGRITYEDFKPLIKDADNATKSMLEREIPETVNRRTAQEAALELTKAQQIDVRAEGSLGKIIASAIPSKYVGARANQAAIDFKREIAQYEEIGSRIARRVESAIKKNPELADEVNAYLNRGGEIPESLYKKVGADLEKFAETRLNAQNELIGLLDSGAYQNLTPEARDSLRNAVQDSIAGNAYNRREYKLFLDKTYKPDPTQRDAALRELSEKMGSAKAKAHMDKLENASAATKSNDPRRYYGAGVDSILKRRHDPGPAERAWLGEVTEAPERIRGTLSGLGRSIARAKADQRIGQELLDAGIGSRQRAGDMVELVLRGTGPDGTGIYVNPEVQVALNQIYLPNTDKGTENIVIDGLNDLYKSAVSGSKASKVLLNTIAYPVQFYGNTINLLGMGINPFRGAGRGSHLALAEFGFIEGITKNPQARKRMLDEINDMAKYGLKGSNVLESDIRTGIEDGLFSKLLSSGIKVKGRTVVPGTDIFGKAYSVPDTMGRYVGWKANQRTLRKIFPQLDDEAIKRQAAHMINDTYQNYDKLSNTVRTLSRWGVMPQFASFTAEFARNQYNQGRIIKQMLQGTYGRDMGLEATEAGIRYMRKEGAKRLAALTAVYVGTFGAIEAMKNLSGVDEDTENALRDVAYAPWDKNRNLMVKYDKDSRKGWTANTSYIVPHSIGLDALKAGMNGDDEASVIRMLKEELIGEGSFVMQEAFRAVFNQDKYGKPITSEFDDLKAAQDKLEYFIAETFRPGAAREVKKLSQALEGKGDYTLKEVGQRQLGLRKNAFDVTEAARFTMANTQKSMADVQTKYKTLIKYGEPPEQEKRVQYEESNRIREEGFNILQRNNQSLKTLGYSESERIEIMKSAGISTKDIISILDGQYRPIESTLTKTAADIYDELPEGRQAKLSAIRGYIRDNPDLGKSLMRSFQQEQRNKQSGLSDKDALIKRLSIDDRVGYILNTDNPEAVLRDLARKGIATDRVIEKVRRLL